MVWESLVNHFGFLPKYPWLFPDASRQKSFTSVILFFVYVTSVFYCPEIHPTFFPRCQNLPNKHSLPKVSSQTSLRAAKGKALKLSSKTFRCLKQVPVGPAICPFSPYPRQQPETSLNLFTYYLHFSEIIFWLLI